MKKLNEKELREFGNLEKIQQHQENKINYRLNQLDSSISNLESEADNSSTDLDNLIKQANNLLDAKNITKTISDAEINKITQTIDVTPDEKLRIENSSKNWTPLKKIELDKDWNHFTQNMLIYAHQENIDLTTNPLNDLLSPNEKSEILKKIKDDFGYKRAHCDQYDYMLSTTAGMISGIIDIIFVGGSNDGKAKGSTDERGALSKASDNWYKNIVLKYAQIDYKIRRSTGIHTPDFPQKKPATIVQAVRYLEAQYKVPYDAQYDSRLNNIKKGQLGLSALNHHLKSLAHYPDLVGLFFSILNQFTNTGTYISNGKIITVSMSNNDFELQGTNTISKLFCGFVNWIGHLASDAVGSSGAVSENHRGSGLPIPGTEVFQLLNFKISSNDRETFSKLCTKVFERGYDNRHATAAKIPVAFNELLTRLLWALKQYFYHQKEVSEIIRIRNIPELDRMLFCSYGVFAELDLTDASLHGIKSPNRSTALYNVFSHLNIELYPRLALQGYKEVVSWYDNNHYNVEEFDNYLDQEWTRLANLQGIY